MLHKGELFKRQLDEHDEMDDFEKFEEVCAMNTNQITMQSTPARANLDFNTTLYPLDLQDNGYTGEIQKKNNA